MKRGFTIAEMLVGMFILSIVVSFFLVPFSTTMRTLRLYRDRQIAQNRILTVEATIRSALENCGAGMPIASDDYKAAFGTTNYPYGWDGPLSIKNSSSKISETLRVAYSVPTDCLATGKVTVGESGKNVVLTSAPNTDYIVANDTDSTKSWVAFIPTLSEDTPLFVTAISSSTNTLTLKSKSGDVTIPKGSRLMLFRVLECRCMSETFYINEYKPKSEVTREEGICGLDFEYDSTNSLLTVYVIARGDEKNLSAGKIEGASKCPSTLITETQSKSQYIRYCEKLEFHVANLAR